MPWLGQTVEASPQTPYNVWLQVSEEVWAFRPRLAYTEAAEPVNHAQILRFFADLNDFYFYTCLLRPLLTSMVQHEKSERFNLTFFVHNLLIAQS
jgi:hypothetical protein